MGLPDEIIKRHPFPGPGLGVRILGEVTKEKTIILQHADHIFIEELIKADQSIILSKSGETDDPVTVDVRRVIRYPTSLHGKSGMKVVELPLTRLDPDGHNAFDPLIEAIPWSKSTRIEKVRALRSDVIYRIRDSQGVLSEGEIYEVDEATATFLVLKKWAEPVS